MSAESHSCLRQCVCPPDGTACALAAACDSQHFVCKNGWQRFSNGQPKCFKPGCLAGSLQETPTRSVENGQAFAVCTCSGANLPYLTCSGAIHKGRIFWRLPLSQIEACILNSMHMQFCSGS